MFIITIQIWNELLHVFLFLLYLFLALTFCSMTLSELGDNYESFWHCSNDHRTVRFVNRSSEWLELKGTLQIGTNRTMSSISKIPPRSVYTHRFVGKPQRRKSLEEESGFSLFNIYCHRFWVLQRCGQQLTPFLMDLQEWY